MKVLVRASQITACTVALLACSNTANEPVLPVGVKETADLYIVDCLLPGQVRRLGGTTYLTARRPTRTTAVDCRIRGGEYVAYDRADYRSALNTWLPMAESGDGEAQTYVGEIFEKGIGGQADYIAAAQWYQKAANQGVSRAQVNLGYLYEKGLGVEKNIQTALNWYRQASGLKDDQLIYQSTADNALNELREELNGKIETAKQQSKVLEQQLAGLRQQRMRLVAKQQDLQKQLARQSNDAVRQKLEQANKELAEAQEQVAVLTGLYEAADKERQALNGELNALPKIAFRSPEPILEPSNQEQSSEMGKNIEFGRYYALIIGNQDYLYLDDLSSPIHDAKRLQSLLENRYGFSTILLPDANEKTILNALNDLYSQIGPKDNLLIYYAGHGNLSQGSSQSRQRGYWLPIDAQQERSTNWISNTVISDHLDRLQARSVLVIADSCYAGNMASNRSPFLLGSAQGPLSEESIRVGLSRRTRLVISSGGVKPVLDGVNGEHSTFARSLIEILSSNKGIMRDNMLFAKLAVNVKQRNSKYGINQIPEMRPIRAAGHGGGDFYFVPQNLQLGLLQPWSLDLALAP